MYLLVAPGGSKSWVLRTLVMGRRCDIGLGSVLLVPLAEAREKAQALRKIAREGGDPIAARRETLRVVPTFQEAARQVHAVQADGFKNAKHSKQWLSSLGGTFAAFGSKRVDLISSADIISALQPHWLKRAETSRRVLQRITTIFDWCKAQGYRVTDNPTAGVKRALPRHKAVKSHHAALPYLAVPQFLRQLRKADCGEVVKLAFEFTILCASRTSETLNTTWNEVNFSAKTWTIPANRMKAGVEHRVPLSLRAIEILKKAKALSDGGPHIFPGRRSSTPLSNMVFLMALRRMGRKDVTPHGFRSSFRDWAAERTNLPRAVCEAALAHTVRDKTEAAYHRTDLFDRRRELMDSWAQFATSMRGRLLSIRT